MGYYLRFFVTDESPLSLAALQQGLRESDASYSLTTSDGDPRSGELKRGGEVYAQVEIESPPGAEGIAELKEELKGKRGPKRKRVVEGLDGAKAVVVVQAVSGGRDWDATLDALTPLWRWLFTNRQGILQADGEGYYDRSGPVLEVG